MHDPGRSSPAAREPARARQVFEPDGRGPWVSDREEGERGVGMTGGARLSSPTLRPRRRRAHRRVFRPRRRQRRVGMGPASSGGCSGGGAARRGGRVHRRRGGTAEELREVVALADSNCHREGKVRGKSQWCTAVLDRAKGGAEEARTARSPAARRGGAPVDPEHRSSSGMN